MKHEQRDRRMYNRTHAKRPVVPTKTLWVILDARATHPYMLWYPSRAEAREQKQWSDKVYPGRLQDTAPIAFDLASDPKSANLWVLIDIDNSKFSGVKNYLWFFTSRAHASKHKKTQNAFPSNARVVGPFPFVSRRPIGPDYRVRRAA